MILTLGSTVGTMVGTGSSVGAVGFGYSNGWAGMLTASAARWGSCWWHGYLHRYVNFAS